MWLVHIDAKVAKDNNRAWPREWNRRQNLVPSTNGESDHEIRQRKIKGNAMKCMQRSSKENIFI